ncbi:MAG: GH36 C-terminal domain-containing protein [Eubacteriales bacterium]
MIQADYVRLTDPFRDPVTAWGFVSKDRQEGVFFAVVTEVHGNMPVNYVCFEELLKNRQYVNKEDGKTYSSEVLRTIGLPVPREQGEYHSYQWHFVLAEREALS